MLRICLLALAAVAVWFLSVYAQTPPAARGADAPAARFSATRAQTVLARLQGPSRPHPAATPENAAVHLRLGAELAALGVKTSALSRMSCYSEARWNSIACADITDLIGEITPGEGKPFDKAVVMMAHMDSVPAGPGAGDDGSGVATILETIRALKARGLRSRHPILAVFTDGEEYGMLGAEAFVRDPAWHARAGIVINMEGRGSNGRSLLFQTSPGNRHLIDLYARSVPRYASSSLNAEVFRFLPNDTDLTPVLKAGLAGYNFAFVGDIADYHTPNDTLANLDPRTLQSHGDNLLGIVNALAQTDFSRLKGGDAAYLDVLGVWLPRVPAGWMPPLSFAVFIVIAVGGWRMRDRAARLPRRMCAGLMPPALLLGCVAAGFAMHFVAATISGSADPSFAHPWALRLGLALGVWSAMMLAAQLGVSAAACWLWLAGLGVVTATVLPGISPYFVFPSLVAAAALPFAIPYRRAALAIPALAAMVVWLGLLVQGEELLGLVAHPFFTVPAAFALIALAPLLPQLEKHAWIRTAAVPGAAALALAIVAGLLPPYTVAQPQRLNLSYVEYGGHAYWTADPVRSLPRTLRAAEDFSTTPQRLPGLGNGYVAAAGRARFPTPSADVTRDGARVIVRIHGSPQADGMTLSVPPSAGLASAEIGGWKFASRPTGRFTIHCAAVDCRDIVLGLTSTAPVTLTLTEQRFGLPSGGGTLIKARGAAAVPSQMGDMTLLVAEVAIPQR